MNTPALPNLSELFSWRAADALNDACEQINHHHERYCKRSVLETLKQEGGPDSRTIWDRLNALSEANASRILNSPELFHHLLKRHRDGSAPLKQFLQNSITAELVLERRVARLNAPVWTALGDHYFPAGPTPHLKPHFQADTLGDNLVFDHSSPNARRPFQASSFREVRPGEALPLSAEEQTLTRSRISEVCERLAANKNPAYLLIKHNTRVFIPRKDTDNADFFSSSSSRSFIGRTIIIGGHLPDINAAQMTNSLIHEALHSFLYKHEVVTPFVDAPDMGVGILLESPWSGGTLNINTYIHACFVYYALLHYWYGLQNRDAFSSQTILGGIEKTVRGFEKGEMFKRLEPHRRHVRPEMLDQLERIQECAVA